MSTPKITIVTPSYNQGSFIEQTLKSVLDQKMSSELEYIVMDGASTDETASVVNKYKKLFAQQGVQFTFISEKDKGQSDAINKGWKRASGDILGYLNTDDYYEPGALKAIVGYFNHNPEKKWAYGGWNIVSGSGKLYSTTQHKNFSKSKLLNYCNIGQPSCFFKKELLGEFGYLDSDLHLAMDYDLWLKFSTKYDAGIINKTLSNMRYHSEAKSATGTKRQLYEIFKLATNYTSVFSWRRACQLFYYIRGMLVIYLGRDFAKRVSRSG